MVALPEGRGEAEVPVASANDLAQHVTPTQRSSVDLCKSPGLRAEE
jgi:hypothetical protein